MDTPSSDGKTKVFKIVCDFLFKSMKDVYKDMSYLKISVLVPKRK